MNNLYLYMVLIGCKPNGRHTEQHDVFFGIASTLEELVPAMVSFWPEAKGKIHLDAWRRVTAVNGYKVEVKETTEPQTAGARLFFINLGGYKQNEFEEFHYKMIIAAGDKGEAVRLSKQTAFYKHTGFKGATSHIDDKYGIDVDDFYEINDIISPEFKKQYALQLTKQEGIEEDAMHLGYFKIDKLSGIEN